MTDSSKYQYYITDLPEHIMEIAAGRKSDRDNSIGTSDYDYRMGMLWALYRIVDLMKRRATVFEIAQEELKLHDVDPVKALLQYSPGTDSFMRRLKISLDIYEHDNKDHTRRVQRMCVSRTDSKYVDYSLDLVNQVKEMALEAKAMEDRAKDTPDYEFRMGYVFGFHWIVDLMKQQADTFEIPNEELNLHDIDPLRDLLI